MKLPVRAIGCVGEVDVADDSAALPLENGISSLAQPDRVGLVDAAAVNPDVVELVGGGLAAVTCELGRPRPEERSPLLHIFECRLFLAPSMRRDRVWRSGPSTEVLHLVGLHIEKSHCFSAGSSWLATY